MPKIDKKKAKIRQALYAGGFLLVSGICITSVSLSSILSKNRIYSNTNFYFNDNVFSSYSDLENYVQSNYFVENLNVENRDKWSITKNGKTFYYNDPALLRKNVANEIKKINGKTSLPNIVSNDISGISASDLSKIYSDNNLKTKTIYKGKNDSIFENSLDAQKSYFSIHDAYYFNGIYFKNKEDLSLYLSSVYYSEKGDGIKNGTNISDEDVIAIIDGDNNYSSGINKKDLISNISNPNDSKWESSITAKKIFADYIKTNSKRYLELTSSIDNSINYFSKDEININNISNIMTDFDYTKVNNTNGKSSYVIDLSQDDENTLFGPYYIQTTDDIRSITDTKNWKKIDSDDPLIAEEKDANQIAGFLGIILVEENTSKTNDETSLPPINIRELNDELNKYFDKLKSFNSKLYNNYLEFLNTIKEGKNFNSFYSVILSYSWIIDNLIKYGAKESLIQDTRDIFDKIAKEIDDKIYKLIPEALLYSNNEDLKGQKISFQKILDFKSNTKNISVDIKYYTDQVRRYSEFINAINIVNLASTNSINASGLIPFDFNMTNVFVENQRTYLDTYQALNRTYEKEYEKLWNMFSSTSTDKFYEILTGTKPDGSENSLMLLDLVSNLVNSSSFFNASYKLMLNLN